MRLEAVLLGALASGCASDTRPPAPTPLRYADGGTNAEAGVDGAVPEDSGDGDSGPGDSGPLDGGSDSGLEGGPDAGPDGGDDAGVVSDAVIRWQRPTGAGLEGSPTHCDLDGDGALEGIVPVAVVDSPELSYLVVVDGSTGLTRWESAPGTASYAYPLCVDVDGDDIEDVLVGGRTADLVALSGVDGSSLWSFAEMNPTLLLGNTHAPAALSENPSTFFFSTGGGATQRIPGQLFAASRAGMRLASWSEPAGREIYTSPALYRSPAGVLHIGISSGGEKHPGSTFLLTYDEVGQSFDAQAEFPTGCPSGGVIASPTFADVSGTEEPELLVADFCGTLTALTTGGSVHWSVVSSEQYATGNPAAADLDGDGKLDALAVFEGFNWSVPDSFDNVASEVIAVKGTTGSVLWRRRLDVLVFATPLTADYDGDGIEDVFLLGAGDPAGAGDSHLQVLEGRSGVPLATVPTGFSSSTPALGDLNANGALDLLYTQTPSAGATEGSIVLLEFPGAAAPTGFTQNSFRGMPIHDGWSRQR